MNDDGSNRDDTTGVSVYKRDKQINEIQQKIEENRKRIFEKRLALKMHANAKTNPHIKEIIKKYDHYYRDFKTSIKLQIRALEEIMKHLNGIMEEYNQNDDLDSHDLILRNKLQLKKDKRLIIKEIEYLKKLLLFK